MSLIQTDDLVMLHSRGKGVEIESSQDGIPPSQLLTALDRMDDYWLEILETQYIASGISHPQGEKQLQAVNLGGSQIVTLNSVFGNGSLSNWMDHTPL